MFTCVFLSLNLDGFLGILSNNVQSLYTGCNGWVSVQTCTNAFKLTSQKIYLKM